MCILQLGCAFCSRYSQVFNKLQHSVKVYKMVFNRTNRLDHDGWFENIDSVYTIDKGFTKFQYMGYDLVSWALAMRY